MLADLQRLTGGRGAGLLPGMRRAGRAGRGRRRADRLAGPAVAPPLKPLGAPDLIRGPRPASPEAKRSGPFNRFNRLSGLAGSIRSARGGVSSGNRRRFLGQGRGWNLGRRCGRRRAGAWPGARGQERQDAPCVR
jgi:hypothetical protein